MSKRFRTADGRMVGVGDGVWTTNHWPWSIVSVDRMLGKLWLVLEHHEVEYKSLRMYEDDIDRYIYASHPPSDCHQAGCQYRPWGVR